MPKASANASVTVEQLYELESNISSGKSTSEADFKTILSAKSASADSKKVAAMFIPRHFEKFPKLAKQAVAAMVDLTSASEVEVRVQAVREISKMIDADRAAITKALLSSLGDDEAAVSDASSQIVIGRLKDDPEFKKDFLASITKESGSAKQKMVDFARDEITFGEEDVEQLLEIIQSALQSCVKEGLRLYGKNKNIVSEEKVKPLVDELLERVTKALDGKFDESVDELLIPILPFTRTLGDEATTKILDIIATRVMPKIENISNDKKITILQKVAETARLVEGDRMIKELYEHVFLKFPTKGEVNMSVVEATLWAFVKLATTQTSTASKLIGTILVYTGQPGEGEDTEENEEHKEAFRSRLEYLEKVAPTFVDQCQNNINNLEAQNPSDEEERKKVWKQLKEQRRAKKTGNNIRHLCRNLLGSDPIHAKLPLHMSWQKLAPSLKRKDEKKRFNRRDDRRDFRRETRRDDRRRDDERRRRDSDRRRDDYRRSDRSRYSRRDDYRSSGRGFRR